MRGVVPCLLTESTWPKRLVWSPRSCPELDQIAAQGDTLIVPDSPHGVVLFVDGDCLNLTSAHLDEICRPFAEGRAVMSLGTFDYGLWNWLVLRSPPTTGSKSTPRATPSS